MTIKLTQAEVTAMEPCNLTKHIALFGRRKTMTAAQALKAGATIPDLLWVAGRLGRKDLCVRYALACAQRVAHFNQDPRVQAALEATGRWVADPSEENRQASAAAAAAAYAASAYASAAAAAAAYAAASAAAYAASASAASASAAAAYAASASASAAAAAAAYAASANSAAFAARQKELDTQCVIFLEIFG